MSDALKQPNRLALVAPPSASHEAALGDRIAAVADLGARTLAAERCAIAFESSATGDDQVVCAPHGDSRWDALVNAALIALRNRLGDAVAAKGSIESIEKVSLSLREIDAIARVENIDDGRRLAASAFTDGASTVRIAIVARRDRDCGELEASLGLIAHAIFSELALAAAHVSLEFWRAHGAESGRQAVGAKRDLVRERVAANELDQAVAAARRARPNDRFERFGALVAGGAGFDRWMVAIADNGSFLVAASSSGRKQFDPGESSALAESFRRHIVIAHWRDRDAGIADRAKQHSEDAMFGDSYVCIPFEAGAIALASRDGHASAARAQAIVERLAPFATNWVMELDALRRRGLVRGLALRMYAAIDEERARIARDLHDDQAQLLAAVKIALEGRREAARPIFKQVEQELRRKTRELRPATIGNASLDQAIAQEFARLDRAGVKVKLIRSDASEKIPRPVQQLCFLVVREALSNVIRHAHAKSVEIAIDRIDATARISIRDDGGGIGADKGGGGIGLAGVRERLELMGGSLTVESRAGRTAIIAEIPEPA